MLNKCIYQQFYSFYHGFHSVCASNALLVSVTKLHKKKTFSIKGFFRKCGQIRSFLQIWSHLLKKSLIENFVFCAVSYLFYRSKWESNNYFEHIFHPINTFLVRSVFGTLLDLDDPYIIV